MMGFFNKKTAVTMMSLHVCSKWSLPFLEWTRV